MDWGYFNEFWYRDRRRQMSNPEPVNEDDFKAEPEIRGGNRPADYIGKGEHSGVEYVFGGAEESSDDDPDGDS